MTDVVCLSASVDLEALFSEAFARCAPELRLVTPDAQFALAYDPPGDAFERFPELRLICAWGAGVDGLLRHPGLPDDLPIKRMTDPSQAQMMAAFAAYWVTGWQRRMWDYDTQQAGKIWREVARVAPEEFPVGILGYGRMGAAIGAGLSALGFPVTAWASRARVEGPVRILDGAAGFDAVIGESAAVINVLPLTEATRGVLNAGAFARMREDAILIQLGRGAHLVEPDLLAALDAGRPGLAALDVTAVEPLPEHSPLWTHPKVRITPHVASTASPDGVARSVAEGIAAFERGEAPDGLVDRSRAY